MFYGEHEMDTSPAHIIQSHWPALIERGYRIIMYPGQIVFYVGHIPHGLYILHFGTVEFSAMTHECLKESPLHAPSARMLCLQHVLDAAPYCCTCTVVETCVFTVVPRAQIQTFVVHAAQQRGPVV